MLHGPAFTESRGHPALEDLDDDHLLGFSSFRHIKRHTSGEPTPWWHEGDAKMTPSVKYLRGTRIPAQIYSTRVKARCVSMCLKSQCWVLKGDREGDPQRSLARRSSEISKMDKEEKLNRFNG